MADPTGLMSPMLKRPLDEAAGSWLGSHQRCLSAARFEKGRVRDLAAGSEWLADALEAQQE